MSRRMSSSNSMLAGVVTANVWLRLGNRLVISMPQLRTRLLCMSALLFLSLCCLQYFTSAKFEAPENDLPVDAPFRVQGFPTLKFRAAGSRDFIDYEGDRSLESLISFIEEHAKNPLDLPEEKPVETPVAEQADDAQVPVNAPPADEPEVTHEEL